MTIGSHRDLLVWQKAMDLMVDIYRIAQQLSVIEKFALASQIRRAASSIPANIAEGKARRTTRNFLNFLSIADGSLAELDTHFEAAARLGYISRETQTPFIGRMEELGRMIHGLKRSLEKNLK